MIQIEIDEGSGFCFGVTTAIKKAEEELAQSTTLYCLGDIVHNGMECERLRQMGLVTINHDDLPSCNARSIMVWAGQMTAIITKDTIKTTLFIMSWFLIFSDGQ